MNGKYKNKAYPLRINETTMKKIALIAEKENRTRNKHIEHILETHIKEYEKENGVKIEVESDE